MIIDMHYHLDERMEPMNRLLEQMSRFKIDKIALVPPMVDPFHVEGVADKLARFSRKTLTGSWNWFGRMIYESTVTKSGQFNVLGKKYNIDQMPDNTLVAQAMAQHPDKFYGWFFINPSREDAAGNLENAIGHNGWIGAKCHPFWHQYAVSQLDDAAALCAERSIPLLIHLGGKAENGDFTYLPERHPNLKIIYAHAGVPHYQRLWEWIKDRENCFVDLSSPYLDETLRRETVKTLGPQKCLYGTDGPFGYPAEDHMYDHGAILSEIDRFGLSADETDKILGDNFKAVAGLSDKL